MTLDAVIEVLSAPLPRVGLSLGEFIGHRVWEVHLLDGVQTLRSWVYPCYWIPGEYVTDESHSDGVCCNGPIDDHNERGVWAFKSAEERDYEFRAHDMSRGLVYGTCWMWGTIIEHEKGYRSKYARVRTIERTEGPHWGIYPSFSYQDRPVNDINLDFLRQRYMLVEE